MPSRFLALHALFVALLPAAPCALPFCDSYACDSLVVRAILDSNDLYDVPVESVSVKSPSFDRILDLLLDSMDIHILPPEIGRLNWVTHIYLARNRLQRVPDEFGQLPKLRYLELFKNKLERIDPGLTDLPALENLYLGTNPISSVPKEIGKLRTLKYLQLRDSRIPGLPPEIGDLASLTTLQVDHLGLLALPAEIGRLSRLKNLMANNNALTEIPASIGRLDSLQEVYLQYNRISSLPPEVGDLRSLKRLYIYWNELTDLPPEIAQLSDLEWGAAFEGNRLCNLNGALSDWLNQHDGEWSKSQQCLISGAGKPDARPRLKVSRDDARISLSGEEGRLYRFYDFRGTMKAQGRVERGGTVIDGRLWPAGRYLMQVQTIAGARSQIFRLER
jgi:Leucine-rich repeat (LRR) protein